MVRQPALQLQAVQFRHRHVQHETGVFGRTTGFKECTHRGETAHLETLRPQQAGERFDHLRLVVENIDDVTRSAHGWHEAPATGSSKWKTAPRSG